MNLEVDEEEEEEKRCEGKLQHNEILYRNNRCKSECLCFCVSETVLKCVTVYGDNGHHSVNDKNNNKKRETHDNTYRKGRKKRVEQHRDNK